MPTPHPLTLRTSLKVKGHPPALTSIHSSLFVRNITPDATTIDTQSEPSQDTDTPIAAADYIELTINASPKRPPDSYSLIDPQATTRSHTLQKPPHPETQGTPNITDTQLPTPLTRAHTQLHPTNTNTTQSDEAPHPPHEFSHAEPDKHKKRVHFVPHHAGHNPTDGPHTLPQVHLSPHPPPQEAFGSPLPTIPETKSITSTPTFFSQRTSPKTQPSFNSRSTPHKRPSEHYTPQVERVWKSRNTNKTATFTTPHNHFTAFADNTEGTWRPNIAQGLSNYKQNACHKKHQRNTQHTTRSTSSFTRRTRRRIALPIGASPTIFAVHYPTHDAKLGLAPSVSHVSPHSTKPNLNSCSAPPHFPSPARDNQLATFHIPLRRF